MIPAMEMEVPGQLAALVRERRVRFTVALEKVVANGESIPVGFDVRLLAWHGYDRHELESCATCAALAALLRSIADYSVAAEAPITEIEIDPDYSVLYDSPDKPGTDEVALDVRLLRRGDDNHSAGAGEERALKQVKARLKALGVREC